MTKSCSPAAFGIDMHCRVTLTSTGTRAPKGPVGFSDLAEVLSGPASASTNPLIVSATPDDANWQCTDLPDRFLDCTIPGAILQPGQSRSVDTVMDISEVVGTADWSVRNCATLNSTKQTRCVTRGEQDNLIVMKTGPNQRLCVPGGPCDFEVSVFNPGKRTFDGTLFFGDNLTIGGVPANGISVDNISPAHGCAIASLTLPLEWQCHMTIPPDGFRSFNILTTVPPGAIPAGAAQIHGRNCFVATHPSLAFTGNAVSPDFWDNLLDPANVGDSPGAACIDFDIGPGAPPVRPPGLLPNLGMQLAVKASQSTFSKPGEVITYKYRIQNTGGAPVTGLALTDNKATGIKCPPAKGGSLPAGASTTCSGAYTTTQSDVGKDIVSTANLTGTTATGAVPPPPPAKTIVKFFAPSPSAARFAVTPTPATFTAANQKIAYRYTVNNTGGLPVISFALTDSKATGIKCPPANAGAKGGPLAAGATVTCVGTYTTTASDVGTNIASTASFSGNTSAGAVQPTPTATALVKFVKPGTGKPGGPGTPPLVPGTPKPAGKPELSIVQYVTDIRSFSKAQQRIRYQYQITNTGTVPITSLKVSDNKVTNVKCGRTSIAVKKFVICRGSYVTTTADVGKDLVTEVRAVGTAASGAKTAPHTAKRRVKFVKPKPAAKPDLQVISLNPTPRTFSAANQKISYSITIANSGGRGTAYTVTGKKVFDITCRGAWGAGSKPPPFAGPTGGPFKGYNITADCRGTYTTTVADVGKDIKVQADVIAIIASGPVAKGPKSAKTAVVKFVKPKVAAKPQLTFYAYTPRPGSFLRANEKIAVSYHVFNYGKVPVKSFTITDSKVKNIKCPPANSGPNGGPLVANKGYALCKGTYTVTQADIGKDISLRASLKGTTASGPIPPAPRHTKTAVVKFRPTASVMAQGYTANYGTFSAANKKISYTYTIMNLGTVPIAGFTITDTRVKNIKCGPANTGPSGGPLAISGSKGRKDTVRCYGTYTTTAADVGKDLESRMTVTAITASGPIPPKPLHSQKVVVKFVAPKPAGPPVLNVTVTPVPATFSKANQKITYRYTVRNSGKDEAVQFRIADTKATGIVCPGRLNPAMSGARLAPGSSVQCTGTYTTKPSDVGKDIASAITIPDIQSKFPVSGVPRKPVRAVVKFLKPKVVAKPTFSLHVECSPKVYAAAGQTIGCEFVVRNIGTVPVTSCRITGSRLNAICPPGLIPPGGSVLVKGSYTTTAADIGKNFVIDYKLDGMTQ